jgi:hypothetical protein
MYKGEKSTAATCVLLLLVHVLAACILLVSKVRTQQFGGPGAATVGAHRCKQRAHTDQSTQIHNKFVLEKAHEVCAHPAVCSTM